MRKNRIIWFVCFILSLICITLYGGVISYGFFFAVALLPVFSAFYLLCVFWRFKLYQELGTKNVVAGQAIPYYFVLQNEDFFSFSSICVHMYEDFSKVTEFIPGKEYELLPGENYRWDTTLTCTYRGQYHVGVRDVQVRDFFGLFVFRYRVREALDTIVKPRVTQVTAPKTLRKEELLTRRENRQLKTANDVSVRNYERGDSVRQVHWKASARFGELMVREQTGEEKEKVLLFLDTRKYAQQPEKYLPLENKELETFLAISYFMTKSHIDYSAQIGQRRQGTGYRSLSTEQDFERLYQACAEVAFDGLEENTGLAALVMDLHVYAYHTLVLVAHEVSASELLSLKSLSEKGVGCILYIISNEASGIYATYDSPDFRIHILSVDADLEEVL